MGVQQASTSIYAFRCLLGETVVVYVLGRRKVHANHVSCSLNLFLIIKPCGNILRVNNETLKCFRVSHLLEICEKCGYHHKVKAVDSLKHSIGLLIKAVSV